MKLIAFCLPTAMLAVAATPSSAFNPVFMMQNQSCSAAKQTFTYTGSDQTLTVPAGCKKLIVKAWGAGGSGVSNTDGYGREGGAGGYVTATIHVTSPTYTVIVGAGGVQAIANRAATYGGGGAANGVGGQGGGRSAIRLGTVDLVTAAGGGGGGYGGVVVGGTYYSPTGGEGGGLTGGQAHFDTTSGRAGTQAAGGAAQGSSTAGTQYTGGSNDGGFAGSGGGGWYGGGGGGSGPGLAGSGGGGSSYYSGANVTDGSTTMGTLNSAPNTGDTDYVSGVAAGSTPPYGGNVNGGNGRVVVYFQ